MIQGILSISGKPGLYRLVSRGKNTLIVENLQTRKRMPVYPHDKVISWPTSPSTPKAKTCLSETCSTR